jgi:hypothetical protein
VEFDSPQRRGFMIKMNYALIHALHLHDTFRLAKLP